MKEYVTTNLDLAAVLLSLGFTDIGFSNIGSKRVEIKFDWDERIPTAEREYWNGNLAIEPRLLFVNRKNLKGRIHDVSLNESV